jgi:Co/Zn/Cd efflux system component
VLADALTSVLAIAALLAGRFYGWVWLDPGGKGRDRGWSLSLIRSAGGVLLDTAPPEKLTSRIRDELERAGDRVADLHVWRLGPGHFGVIASRRFRT